MKVLVAGASARTPPAPRAFGDAAGNPALVLTGLVTSLIFGWQRAASAGVLAPAVTHATWSALMLRLVPPLFRGRD